MSPVPRRTKRKKTGRRRQMSPFAISGLMIFVTLFIVYYAFNQGLPFVSQYTMYALVNNSVNVRSESPVRIAGIDVGVVQGTEPDGDLTKITFTMDSDGLPIHTDATIAIRDRLFLEGGYYLNIDPGSPDAPIAPEGFTIQAQNTTSPVQFYKVLSTFNASARTDLQQTLGSLNTAFSPMPGQPESDSGAGGLKQALPQMTPLLKDIALVSQSLQGTHALDLEHMLQFSSDITTTLNHDADTLNSLVTGLNVSSAALVANDDDLAHTISGVDQVLRAAPPALTAINNSLHPLGTLAQTLTPSLKIAPPLVTGISNTVAKFNAIITPAKRGPLLTALRTTFTNFPKILTQLGGVFPVTKAVTDCLSSNVIPLLNSKIQDGSLSTGQPVWQEFLHFLPNVAGASGSFDADGHFTRVLLGVGSNSLTGGLLDTVTSTLGAATKLVGISPGGGTISGAAPHWIGTLTPADFRPDVPCAGQKVPTLTATTATPDLTATRTPASDQAPAAIANDLALAEGKKS